MRTCLWTAAIVSGVLAVLRIWLGITLPKQAKVHAHFALHGTATKRIVCCNNPLTSVCHARRRGASHFSIRMPMVVVVASVYFGEASASTLTAV